MTYLHHWFRRYSEIPPQSGKEDSLLVNMAATVRLPGSHEVDWDSKRIVGNPSIVSESPVILQQSGINRVHLSEKANDRNVQLKKDSLDGTER